MSYLLFGGDFVPCANLYTSCKNNEIYCDGLRKEINGADHFFVNLESPLTNSKEKISKSGPNLKCAPEHASIFQKMGITDAFLANNHMMDYGYTGLNETITTCSQYQISTYGAGANRFDASRPKYIDFFGVKIGIINIGENEFGAATEVQGGINSLDIIESVSFIREAKKNCDILILSFHGGVEHYDLPSPRLRKLCRFFIAEGVDLVLCHHTHIISGYENYLNGYIHYGLGNFAFSVKNPTQSWSYGLLLKLHIDIENKRIQKIDQVFFRQNIQQYGIQILSDNEKNSFISNVENLKSILINDEMLNTNWKALCSAKYPEYFTILFFPFIGWPVRILKYVPWLKLLINPKSRQNIRHNLIRCESHNEIINTIFEMSRNNAK